MEKKTNKKPPLVLPEKHPLREIPAKMDMPVSEEELDLLPIDEEDETPAYEPPVEGEGP